MVTFEEKEKQKVKAIVELMEHRPDTSKPKSELKDDQVEKLYNLTKYFIPPPENLMPKTL